MIFAYILITLMIVLILGLNEFHLVTYIISIIMVLVAIRMAWSTQSKYTLVGIGLFLIGFLLARIFESILLVEHQKRLEVFYNTEQFKNIISKQYPKISASSVYNIFFIETNPNRGRIIENVVFDSS